MESKMCLIVLGEITFLDEQIDGINKAIVNNIEKITFGKTTEQTEKIGEDYINKNRCGSYLIPSLYNGEIVY